MLKIFFSYVCCSLMLKSFIYLFILLINLHSIHNNGRAEKYSDPLLGHLQRSVTGLCRGADLGKAQWPP